MLFDDVRVNRHIQFFCDSTQPFAKSFVVTHVPFSNRAAFGYSKGD